MIKNVQLSESVVKILQWHFMQDIEGWRCSSKKITYKDKDKKISFNSLCVIYWWQKPNAGRQNLSNVDPLLNDFRTFVRHYQPWLEDCGNDTEWDGIELVDGCQHWHWLNGILLVSTMWPNSPEAMVCYDILEQFLTYMQIQN